MVTPHTISSNPVIVAMHAARREAQQADDLDALTAEMTEQELAELLDNLEVVTRWSRSAKSHASTVLAQRLHGNSTTLESYEVTISPGHLERDDWQHEEIAKAIARDVAPRQPQAGVKIVKAIIEAAGIGYWRTKVLPSHGITADQFSSSHRGKPGVSVTRRQSD